MLCVVASVVVAALTALLIVDLLVDVGRSEWLRRGGWCVLSSKWCEECPFAFPWWVWEVLHSWHSVHNGHPNF